MKNSISMVEIPTVDFSRAVAFYRAILGISIEEVEMGGVQMGLFPNDGESVFVQLTMEANTNLLLMALSSIYMQGTTYKQSQTK